jgi:hypothetical protein
MKVCSKCSTKFANWQLLKNHHVRQWEQCLDIAVEKRLTKAKEQENG